MDLFLDANILVDLIEERANITWEDFEDHDLSLSPLTAHIIVYSFKYKIPNAKLSHSLNFYNIVPLSEEVLLKALSGPTPDLEDNIQLHSAAEANCNIFLTRDKKLLRLGYFGKTKITDHL